MPPRRGTPEKDALPAHYSLEERQKEDSLREWKEKHHIADSRLLRLEEELDVLFYWAREVREERTKLTQNRLQYPDNSSAEPFIPAEDSHGTMDEYLSLFHKSKALEDMIQALKEECAACRSECNYLLSKIRRLSPRQKPPQLLGPKSLHTPNTLPYGVPESGFTDPYAVAKRIMDAEDTATSVGAVVGALGAGIAYTTLFSATRGRLDLISWAFTCFILVVISCTAYQVFSLPRQGQISRILRTEFFGSAEHRLFSYILVVALPMVAGFILLALSVAFLDADSSSTVPGSQPAIRVAGYLPIAFLGYFVVTMIIITVMAIGIRILSWYEVLKWPTKQLPPEARKSYPSLFFALKDKLLFLPGGRGYALYRSERLRKAATSNNIEGSERSPY